MLQKSTFLPWGTPCRFMEKCVCPLNVSDSLEEAAYIILHGLVKFGIVWNFCEVSIFLGLTCVWTYESIHVPWLDCDFAVCVVSD